MRFSLIVLFATLLSCALQEPLKAQVATPCRIPAFPNLTIPTGQSALDPMSGQPVIFFNPAFINSLGGVGPVLFRYLLAHECAHHLNGDIVAQHIDPQGMLFINPQVELRADCDAARYLRSQADFQAIQVAIQFWSQAANARTGPNYPTGFQRSQMIFQCSQ